MDRLGPRCIHLLLTFDSLCDTLGQQDLHFITKRALLTYVYCYAAHDSPAKHRTSTLSTDKPADAGLVRKSGSLPLLLKSSFEVRSLDTVDTLDNNVTNSIILAAEARGQ